MKQSDVEAPSTGAQIYRQAVGLALVAEQWVPREDRMAVAAVALALIALDRAGPVGAIRLIEDAFEAAILTIREKGGARVPSA
jgi:hypothetical protein